MKDAIMIIENEILNIQVFMAEIDKLFKHQDQTWHVAMARCQDKILVLESVLKKMRAK